MKNQNLNRNWILCLSFILCLINSPLRAEAPTILVSVAPYKLFVEKIAGDTIDVNLMVPAGASAHTYEPTPRQMIAAGKAVAWFTIGESFEGRAIPALKARHCRSQTRCRHDYCRSADRMLLLSREQPGPPHLAKP
jgi:ABC-type Zn uptake system ZnuABC Zn-binding protein ZnuA